MTKLVYAGCVQMATALLLSLYAAAPAYAEKHQSPSCQLVEGHGQAKFARLANRLMAEHYFYQQLVKEKGKPAKCRGGLGNEQPVGEYSWVDFTWPDQSTLKLTSEPPETAIIEYNRAEGLTRPEEVISLMHEYAARVGLKFDWTKPRQANEPYLTNDGKFQVIEYQDPEAGNAFVRFMYDRQQRLVGVWYSLAL